jgi:hypothetical protein
VVVQVAVAVEASVPEEVVFKVVAVAAEVCSILRIKFCQ